MSAELRDDIIPATEVPRDMDGYGNVQNHRPPWYAVPVLSFLLSLLLIVLVWLGSSVMGLKTNVASMKTDLRNLDSNVQFLVTHEEAKSGP